MFKFIVLGILIISISSLMAQNSSVIKGKIFDSETSKPIENCEVINTETGEGVTTENSGYFEFTGLNFHKYVIKIKHIGYFEQTIKVVLKKGEVKDLHIFLVPKIEQLNEIIIEDQREKNLRISKLPYIETKIIKSQIDGGTARDVGDFLRGSNNVSGIRKGGSSIDPVIRGFKFSQLNVQINNGQKIEGGCPNRMDPASAHVNLNNLESIEIIKGPYALKYGPVMGGVINMKTLNHEFSDNAFLKVEGVKGYETNWNGNNEQISLYGGNRTGFFNLTGGRKDYGNYKDGNGNEVKSGFSKYNYTGELGLQPFKNHTITAGYEKSVGENILFPTLPMDERKDETQLYSLDYNIKEIKSSLKNLKIKLYRSDVKHEMDNKNRPFSDTVVAVSNIKAIDQGGRIETDFKLSESLSLDAGADFEQTAKDGRRTKYMILQPGLPIKNEQLWNNALINNTGIFAEFSGVNNSLEFIGAMRIDFNVAMSDEILIRNKNKEGQMVTIYNYGIDSIKSNYTNYSFSVGLTKHIKNDFSVSVAIGRGVRSPDITERYIILLPIGYDNFDYLGNPQLKPETNNQVDLTFKYINDRFGLFQLNGFYAIVNNYITGKQLAPIQQKPLTAGVLGVKQFVNAGNARLTGFELLYSTPLRDPFVAEIQASWTYGTIDEVTKYILNQQGEVVDNITVHHDALTEIPPFESTIMFHYNFFKGKFVPKASVRMVAAQSHVSEAFYEKKTPGFIVTTVSFNFIYNKYLTVSGGVNNIFNKAYYEHLNRNIVGSTANYFEPGRIFYLNLSFKI